MPAIPPGADPLKAVAPCVARLCQALDQRDLALLAAQLAPDLRWTIVGRPDRFPFGGTRQRTEMIESIAASLGTFSAFAFEVIAAAQAGAVAFVEASAHGTAPGGAIYQNLYLMRFHMRDGLVCDVLEHYDPFEALAFVEQLTG